MAKVNGNTSLDELSKLSGIPYRTLARWARVGRLSASQPGGPRTAWYVPNAERDRVLSELGIAIPDLPTRLQIFVGDSDA